MPGRALRLFGQLIRDLRAVMALEYAIIGSVVAFVVIAAVTNFGSTLTTAYSDIGAKLSEAVALMGGS
jgi:Flp pilus assembly pilin Flp